MAELLLTHVTFNTGHAAQTPASAVTEQTVGLLTPLLGKTRAAVPKMPGWVVTTSTAGPIGQMPFTIEKPPLYTPWVMAVVCWNEHASMHSWEALTRSVHPFLESLRSMEFWQDPALDPPPVPWLGVVLSPSIVQASAEEMVMLGDLERCLAWTAIANFGRPAGAMH